MKMKVEHYEVINTSIGKLSRDAVLSHAARVQNAKRLRWDCLHAAKLTPFVCDVLYHYLDDRHIDTALRRIMRDHGYAGDAS